MRYLLLILPLAFAGGFGAAEVAPVKVVEPKSQAFTVPEGSPAVAVDAPVSFPAANPAPDCAPVHAKLFAAIDALDERVSKLEGVKAEPNLTKPLDNSGPPAQPVSSVPLQYGSDCADGSCATPGRILGRVFGRRR